jgi:hypothetical protein
MSPTIRRRNKITPAPIPIDMPRFCGSFASPVVTAKLEINLYIFPYQVLFSFVYSSSGKRRWNIL